MKYSTYKVHVPCNQVLYSNRLEEFLITWMYIPLTLHLTYSCQGSQDLRLTSVATWLANKWQHWLSVHCEVQQEMDLGQNPTAGFSFQG